MEIRYIRHTGIAAVITSVFTLLWIILLVTDQYGQAPVEDISDVAEQISHRGWLFNLTYLNAGLLTLVVPSFYVALYLLFRKEYRFWSVLALLYVAAYLTLNIISYFSQLVMVPQFSVLEQDDTTHRLGMFGLALFAQQWPFTYIGFMNGLAYGILGLPSLIFGAISLKMDRLFKWGGLFLALSGVASIIGFAGLLTELAVLIPALILGGGLFFISLLVYSALVIRKKINRFDI